MDGLHWLWALDSWFPSYSPSENCYVSPYRGRYFSLIVSLSTFSFPSFSNTTTLRPSADPTSSQVTSWKSICAPELIHEIPCQLMFFSQGWLTWNTSLGRKIKRNSGEISELDPSDEHSLASQNTTSTHSIAAHKHCFSDTTSDKSLTFKNCMHNIQSKCFWIHGYTTGESKGIHTPDSLSSCLVFGLCNQYGNDPKEELCTHYQDGHFGPESQTQPKMRYHFILIRRPSLRSQQIKNAGEGVDKRVPSFTVGGNIKWYNHCGKQYASTS